ncbi:MAG: retroviral-like aspartic protease family protein [Anaerolineae bacterium]
MTVFPFDSTYHPALPVCDVALIAPPTGYRVELTAIIDTGADGTIVPIEFLQQIGARRAFEAGLRSQWGEPRTVFLYLVDLQIAELRLPAIYVVGDELGDEVVLGRNVLNELRLLLDGPAALTRLLNDTASAG